MVEVKLRYLVAGPLVGAPGLDGVVVCKMASRVAEHVKAARL
jgi:hypothetical protein